MKRFRLAKKIAGALTAILGGYWFLSIVAPFIYINKYAFLGIPCLLLVVWITMFVYYICISLGRLNKVADNFGIK